MRALRIIIPGILVLLAAGFVTTALMGLAQDRSWIPQRNTGSTRGLAVLFIVSDILVGAAMVGLLLTRERFPPKRLEWLFPLRGKWLWCTLFSLTVAAYAALAPVFLFFLASLRRP